MEPSSYILILRYLQSQKRQVAPSELSSVLQRSRVTVQSSLKRLVKNGWVTKSGASPKTFYQANELSLVPRETVARDNSALKNAETSIKRGMLEDFVYKSNKVVDYNGESYSKSMKPLICFDLDGTLTPDSTWKLLNQKLGITDEDDSRLYDSYVAGEIPNYEDWMNELVNLHKASGTILTKDDIVALAQDIPLALGAEGAIRSAQEKGYEVLMLSGSVDTIVEVMARRLGIGNWLACAAIIYDDSGIIVDIQASDHERVAKLNLLETFCTTHGYMLADVIAVGDGGNELEIFKVTKGVLVGNNTELRNVAWKQVATLPQIVELM